MGGEGCVMAQRPGGADGVSRVADICTLPSTASGVVQFQRCPQKVSPVPSREKESSQASHCQWGDRVDASTLPTRPDSWVGLPVVWKFRF